MPNQRFEVSDASFAFAYPFTNNTGFNLGHDVLNIFWHAVKPARQWLYSA